jgi:thiamine transporter ThiT
VAKRTTQWHRIRRELSALAFRLGCAAGIVVGLLWGLHHQPNVVCARTAPRHDVIGQCATHSISVIGLHWVLALGGGLLAGALAGAAFALLVRPKAA